MLTVTIITKNEEQNIGRAIASVKELADEVIVVDSGSTDKTVELARKLGAKVYLHKFKDFSSQKNFAASKATHDWILSLDADEEISKELAAEIKATLTDPQYDAYLIPRRNYILGGEIKYSRWSPDKHIWLWNRETGKWSGDVHEEVVTHGKVGELKSVKLHYQDDTISEFIESLNRYTQLEAKEKYNSGERFSILIMVYETVKSFIGRYILKTGYKDGWRGFTLCTLRAFYKAVLWLKILELQKRR